MTDARSDAIATPAPELSIVVPAFNEADNLPALYAALVAAMQPLGIEWELVVVDDHSRDDTFDATQRLAAGDPRVRGLRLSNNCGSHLAIRAGLAHARGRAAVVMAADMQDPPAVIPELLQKWRDGYQVVWAARRLREGEKRSNLAFASIYWWTMRKVIGMRDVPAAGADFFLLDARVVDALQRYRERDVNIVVLISWIGFRQTAIQYDKQPRLHGRSGWSLAKKIKIVIDSVTSFSYLPIRAMSLVGFLVAFGGFVWALAVLVNYLSGSPPLGWSSTIMAVLLIGGTQMVMLGVIGEYLWRTLEQARRRPLYLVENATTADDAPGSAVAPPAPDVPGDIPGDASP